MLGAGVVHGLCIAALLPLLVVLPAREPSDGGVAEGIAATAPSAEASLIASKRPSDPVTTAAIPMLPRPGTEGGTGRGAAEKQLLPEPVPAHVISDPADLVELAAREAEPATVSSQPAAQLIDDAPPVEVLTARDASADEVAGIGASAEEPAAKPSAHADATEVARAEPADSRAAPAAQTRKAPAAKAPAPRTRAAAPSRKPVARTRTASPRAAASARRPVAQQTRPGIRGGPFSFLFGKPVGAGQSAARR